MWQSHCHYPFNSLHSSLNHRKQALPVPYTFTPVPLATNKYYRRPLPSTYRQVHRASTDTWHSFSSTFRSTQLIPLLRLLRFSSTSPSHSDQQRLRTHESNRSEIKNPTKESSIEELLKHDGRRKSRRSEEARKYKLRPLCRLKTQTQST